MFGNEPIGGYITIAKEDQTTNLHALVGMFFNEELPIPLYDTGPDDPDREQVGEIIMLELFEDDNGVHTLRGMFQPVGNNNINNIIPNGD